MTELDDAAAVMAEVADDTPDQIELPDPAHRAHQLRLTGLAWPEVASQAGYPTAQNAIAAVAAYLQRAALDQAAELGQMALTQELARLDELQAKWWTAATLLDKDAAAIVLKIMAQRARLLQLEGATKVTERQTIIITSGDDMAEHLRRLALGEPPPVES